MIDIDNPDDLAAKGLKRIQIDGEEEEFLMDLEGNIYDLQGNFIGTTDGATNEDDQQFEQEMIVEPMMMEEENMYDHAYNNRNKSNNNRVK